MLTLLSFALLAQTQGAQATAPVPADPHELVTSGANVPATPADRVAALALLERAMVNSKLHMPGTPPFRFDVSFNASGAKQAGAGQLTEIWLSGQKWRWTADLGGSSVVRIGSGGRMVDALPAPEIPMRAHMLRNAIFWGARQAPSNAQLRTAATQWNGKPVTCVLVSFGRGSASQSPSRLWEEEEFCIDNAAGLLQIHSIAPGTYTVYGYGANIQFHGLTLPDRITIYVAGAAVVTANFNIADAGSIDESLLTPKPEMMANGPVVELMLPARVPLVVPGGSTPGSIQPVIVHAQVGGDGNVQEVELSATSDPALVQRALDAVKSMKIPARSHQQQQLYIQVCFLPASM